MSDTTLPLNHEIKFVPNGQCIGHHSDIITTAALPFAGKEWVVRSVIHSILFTSFVLEVITTIAYHYPHHQSLQTCAFCDQIILFPMDKHSAENDKFKSCHLRLYSPRISLRPPLDGWPRSKPRLTSPDHFSY